MSDVLARIRVRETHGIRRFLYPLTEVIDYLNDETDLVKSNLVTIDGEVIPCEWIKLNDGDEVLLQFAVSLAPFAEMELNLTSDTNRVVVPDSLTVQTRNGSLITEQQRLRVEIAPEGMPTAVLYDGISHLRNGSCIMRNGETFSMNTATSQIGGHSLSAWLFAEGKYSDGCNGQTRTDNTACKSWITVNHDLEKAQASDEITFHLPLAVTSSTSIRTCDFGVGGGTYGKLQKGSAEEVRWRTEFKDDTVYWTVETAGRTDYAGQTPLTEFRSQRWFHLVDSDKALAVAITEVPASCQEMLVSLTIAGDITITFLLGEPAGATEFGVCYHFLNGIPAIAAATNPQSILLPPTVEVLPA